MKLDFLSALRTTAESIVQFIKRQHVKAYNANYYGVLAENDPLVNSQNLQALMDKLTEKGGTIYIPAGTYRFGENLTTEHAKACIWLRDNVSIKGDGFNTILKPVGNTEKGLDLFHYTSKSYSGNAKYLENCVYKKFTINADEACLTGAYSAMGKGFMIYPMKNVHFKKLNVQNTDGTGIGVDCPVNCSIVDCITYNCGKAGTINSAGASGIGIGFGYNTDECMYISRCKCVNNKKFGIFFEHQKRFDENANPAKNAKGFIVSDCICYDNYYNFGGVLANDVIYRNCISKNAKAHGYFFSNSVNCNCEGCYSESETNTAYVALATYDDFNGKEYVSHNIGFVNCIAKLSPYGVKIVNQCENANLDKTLVKDCFFNACHESNLYTNGILATPPILQGNISNDGKKIDNYNAGLIINGGGENGGEIFNNYTSNSAKAKYSHAEGHLTAALLSYAHAEGYLSTANGTGAHAEGYRAFASDTGAHAEGYGTNMVPTSIYEDGVDIFALWQSTPFLLGHGKGSHVEGQDCMTLSPSCHAEGYRTVTIGGNGTHSEGCYTIATDFQHAQGHYNDTGTATPGVAEGSSNGTAFVIGNGTSASRSNAFRVTYNGTPYAKSALTTTGCDYAEFFEWIDGNPNNEDRRGYFVTLDGEKIKKAEQGDYILGITSALPSIIGNGDECWKGRYILDEFGAFITEEFEYEAIIGHEEKIDEETGEETFVDIKETRIGTKWKENPEYNPDEEYIQREDRPEWSTVGMLGVIAVRDDGTCSVNGFCKLSDGGIATSANDGYRVVARVTDNVIKVIYK